MSYQPQALDVELPQANWQAIEQLLDDLADLARQETTKATDFYRTLLERLLAALDAGGGAIWSASTDKGVRVTRQLARNEAVKQLASALGEMRIAIIEKALQTARPQTSDLSGPGAQHIWSVVHPAAEDKSLSRRIVVELLTEQEVTPAAARAYSRVLCAVCELAEDYERRCELRQLRNSADAWQQYEQFSQQVHRSLELEQAAFALANESRRVIDCDRVSVLEIRGRAVSVAAVSGVDILERRSPAIRALEQFCRRAAAYGEPIWYYDGAGDLADELLAPLEAYLEQSQARVLAVMPLFDLARTEVNNEKPVPDRVIGLLVAEHFHGTTTPDLFRDRLLAVSGHAASALANAQSHSRMPLARLSRALGCLYWLTSVRHLPKTSLALLSIMAVAGLLAFVPADFEVEAKGELQPRERREVFASDDGVVAELLVTAGQHVEAGQRLVQLRKPELDLELRRVLGELETNQKQLGSIRAERLQDMPRESDGRRRDPHELAAEEEELRAKIAGLESQKSILNGQLHALAIASPIAGQALTWDIEKLLAARPVERGQALLSVANIDGPWDLELRVPDDRAGYVLTARAELGAELPVRFTLTADPAHAVTGVLANFAVATELDAQQESTVAATVEFDRQAVGGLRPGATAVAKIYCGRRSLGFVWFHDLFNYLRSWWW
jgi:multidrug efflux pump subunit AcrA (membrane-fusion protein)